jgi:lipid-A-disaccharide synthase
MIVLFKFEEEFYEKHGIKADYAGHPLLDLARPQTKKDELIKNLGIDSGAKIISLLPGSRKQEIRKILPLMLETAELINREIPDTRFIIAKSPNVDMRVYEEECGKSPLKPSFVEGKTCDCLNAADFSLVCSGTATLEAAIIQKPFVIVYKMNALNYLLYRPQVKIPYIGIVNIIAGRKIVPEYIQYAARPQIIAGYAAGLLRDPGKINDFRSDLSSLKRMLGEPGASARAARLILDFLKQ